VCVFYWWSAGVIFRTARVVQWWEARWLFLHSPPPTLISLPRALISLVFSPSCQWLCFASDIHIRKHCSSRLVVVNMSFLGFLNTMSRFQQALPVWNQHIVLEVESNAITAEYISLVFKWSTAYRMAIVYPVRGTCLVIFIMHCFSCTKLIEKKKDVQWQCFMNWVCSKYDCAFGGGRMQFRCF